MNMNKLSLLIICLFCATFGFAQQQNHYTQFMYNKLLLNPGYAGSRTTPSFTAIYRNQWIGFEGSPESKLLSFNSPIGKSVGFGLSISNNTHGLIDNWFATMAYSYRIKLGDESALRVGLQGSIESFSIDFSDPSIVIQQDNDPSVLLADNPQKYYGNFGAGLYLSLKNLYFGLSVPHFFPNELGFNPNTALIAKESPHFYFMAGTMLPVGNKFSLKPQILGKYVQNAPFDADLNLSLVYDYRLTFGVSYRLGGDSSSFGESIDAMLFYQFTNIGLGIAYDFTLSEIKDYTSGSLEFVVRYDFKREREDMANPRFFF